MRLYFNFGPGPGTSCLGIVPCHLILVVGAEERKAEYQGTEQHVEVVKREKETDEDPESEYCCLKRFI